MLFHDPIHKRNKLLTFASMRESKQVTTSQNKIVQIKAERNLFRQLVVLSQPNIT